VVANRINWASIEIGIWRTSTYAQDNCVPVFVAHPNRSSKRGSPHDVAILLLRNCYMRLASLQALLGEIADALTNFQDSLRYHDHYWQSQYHGWTVLSPPHLSEVLVSAVCLLSLDDWGKQRD